MKKFGLGFLLVIWFLFTLLFTLSMVGLFIIHPDIAGDGWFNISKQIINKLLQ